MEPYTCGDCGKPIFPYQEHHCRTAHRAISTIAREIRKDWQNVYFGAVPYLSAMSSLDSIDDKFGYDDAKSIVLYFLSNAKTWRGDVARRVKAELKELCK